ncbi:hypothetical protein J2X19_000847 [Rhodoferax ferrireducens]|uniref:DUF3034 domain-containing protein n=1 Tax=Rhodoferax ferrireducens TaxID=192843 RepID=A0ABU2C4G2_9BURK|nr:DUF3034 family protein [Rhodoferax ferrireducens]MDR7376189.1 hypothetical protein [Rhodoferax ferrireducens]
MRFLPPALAAATLALCSPWALADTGKLLLTGGVSSIDGAAGGGLTPWAVIGSNATAREIGASAAATRVSTQDYGLSVVGAAVGVFERLELSAAKQDFNAGPTAALAGLGVTPGQHIKMDIFGAKLRVAGDAVLDSDNWMPQIAVGLEHKRVHAGSMGPVLSALGAKDRGTDVYANATKLFLAQSLLVNGTLRYTKANQTGLLGFGGALGKDSYRLMPELSVAYLLRKDLAIGAEVRFKPNNLEPVGNAVFGANSGALREDSWKDLFVAWAPSKNFSLTLAYVDLGRIAPGLVSGRKQTGGYLSAQIAF